MSYSVSVIMPALNEELNLERAVLNVIDAFERLKISAEIVIVNDGSTDATGAVASKLKQKFSFIEVLSHASALGIGKGFWDGVAHSRGEVVVLLPGDGENDAYEILRYLPLMSDVDLVIPFVFNKGSRSQIRQVISRTYKWVINKSFGTSLNYMNGTVMYRREVLRKLDLRSHGFFYQTELLIKCLRSGYLYAEVPYGLRGRVKGKSKALSLRALERVARDYIATLFSVYGMSKSEPLCGESVSLQRYQQFSGPTPPEESAHSLASGAPSPVARVP